MRQPPADADDRTMVALRLARWRTSTEPDGARHRRRHRHRRGDRAPLRRRGRRRSGRWAAAASSSRRLGADRGGDVGDAGDRRRAIAATRPAGRAREQRRRRRRGLGRHAGRQPDRPPTASRRWPPTACAERRGAIVNVASVAALVAGPGEPQYARLQGRRCVMLTKSLAVTLGPRGVRANAICPGWVRTPMADAEMPVLDRRHRGRLPAGHPVRPARPPGAARRGGRRGRAFLASDEASYVSGAVLTVDGGMTAVDVGTLAFGE